MIVLRQDKDRKEMLVMKSLRMLGTLLENCPEKKLTYLTSKVNSVSTTGGATDLKFPIFLRYLDKFRHIRSSKMITMFLCVFIMLQKYIS